MKNLIFVIIVFFFSCSSKGQVENDVKFNSRAISLNNEAIKIALDYAPDQKLKYLKIISLLDSATNISPNYHIAYSNKANFQLLLGRKKDALNSASEIVRILPASSEAIFFKGMMLERNGLIDSAKVYYAIANDKFKNLYAKNKTYMALRNYITSLKMVYNEKIALDKLSKEKGKFEDSIPKKDWDNFVKLIAVPRDKFLDSQKSTNGAR